MKNCLLCAGLPGVTICWWFPLENAGRTIGLALLVCIIDICESISIATALARVNKYPLDGTQELRGASSMDGVICWSHAHVSHAVAA